ncbi:hypothetical protein WN55_07689 [Dufourea novaeangliae]|uniref:Uncharacterized protein n=1 Tax=Dufourea novaeangliae TaxID=178035 RepID=A0A154P7T9_DUFNO|nr:hypothetical protein WN55_07689 [Dufourea novaeangliae]
MSTLDMFHLTHPEVLSDPELREILENSCIDFTNYKHLSRPQLIELYKRVAMPLPRRGSENSQDLDTKKTNEEEKKDSADNCKKDILSLNGKNNTQRNVNGTKIYQTSCPRPKTPVNDLQHTPKKIHSCSLYSFKNYNGVDKRVNDGTHDDSPSKKRQKITWP